MIWVFKIPYSDFLKHYKILRYLDDIDLKMFKKNEVFKYNFNKENDFIYDQHICATENKKIIIKTKYSKYEEFDALPDYIASRSTSLKDILIYMNSNYLNEVRVQCILTVKDFEANLKSNTSEAGLHSLCLRAYEDGLINKYGSVFKILKLTNKKILFENSLGIPVYSIHSNDPDLNTNNMQNDLFTDSIASDARSSYDKNNNSKNLDGSNDSEDIELINQTKPRIYQSEDFLINNEQKKFMENYNKKILHSNNKPSISHRQKEISSAYNSLESSFIEVSTSTKFYSNDLLIKIEDGMNHITEKIIDNSKKISELSK